jgi:hypothetical protein
VVQQEVWQGVVLGSDNVSIFDVHLFVQEKLISKYFFPFADWSWEKESQK